MSNLNWSWWIKNRPERSDLRVDDWAFTAEQRAFIDAAFREYETVIVHTIARIKRTFSPEYYDTIHDEVQERFLAALLSFQEMEAKQNVSCALQASATVGDQFLKWLKTQFSYVRGQVAREITDRVSFREWDDCLAETEREPGQTAEIEVTGVYETWEWLLGPRHEDDRAHNGLGGDPTAMWSWLVE